MDPGDAFSAGLFRWDPRPPAGPPPGAAQPCPTAVSVALAASQQHDHSLHDVPQPPIQQGTATEGARELEEVFEGYGVRYSTVSRIGDLGFTASTLVGMREEEVEDMMTTLSHFFRWDLLVGERYGIKAAIRAERRRLEALIFSPASGAHYVNNHQHQMGYLLSSAAVGHHHLLMPDDPRRRLLLLSPDQHNALDALSQEGLSEEPVQLEREAVGSGGEIAGRRDGKGKNQQRRSSGKKKGASSTKCKKKKKGLEEEEGEEEEEDAEVWGCRAGNGIENDDDGEESQSERSGGAERQREHPFIVTEPGEVARAKKNGLDYLFHLYEQCHEFLLRVQAMAKERGDKCPTKVTNLVFRYAKKVGASYINKPKMRHYVHCYALHVLDEDASNSLRLAFKERGENVGAWRLACYKPLVAISASHAFDIDAVFNAHPRLSIWYVPTKLRQLCHLARNSDPQLPPAGAPRTSSSSSHRGATSTALGGQESAADQSLRPPMF